MTAVAALLPDGRFDPRRLNHAASSFVTRGTACVNFGLAYWNIIYQNFPRVARMIFAVV